MRLARTSGLAITAKEFAQWITLVQSQNQHSRRRPFLPTRSDATLGQHDEGAAAEVPLSDASRQHQVPQNIGVAVSGGVDSMALVTMLARHYRLLEGSPRTRLHAFIVDHKLRNNSTEEAEFVASQVQKLDVTPHVLTLDWSSPSGLTTTDNLPTITQKPDRAHLETRARLERYKAITLRCDALQIKDIFVGHHSGDQVETVHFRFSRASGIDGLSGIQDVAPLGVVNVVEGLDINVLRPLLNASKERLKATCEEAGTLWVEDPSNQSLDYQRNVIRHYQQDVDAQLSREPLPKLHPLSTAAMLGFQKRMSQHRKHAWDQVRPWLQGIMFDSQNGVCHIKLQTDSTSGDAGSEAPSSVGWLHSSQNHVATRLLSFLVRWVNCRDHAPRLEEIQTLLKHLQDTPSKPALSTTVAYDDSGKDQHDNDNTSTVYKKERTRTSWRRQWNAQNVECLGEFGTDMTNMMTTRSLQAINVANVLLSPPRSTKGIPHCWTLSRQPMSRLEQKANSNQLRVYRNGDENKGEKVDHLWDQRFFIRLRLNHPPTHIINLSSKVIIRPLTTDDVRQVRNMLEIQGGALEARTRLEEWLQLGPGKARFTIPVVFSTDEDRILSIPTLGIHVDPTPLTVCSWFKSKIPQDGQDMRQPPRQMNETQ
ncbi:PP-loop family-domain-containing protein [Mortierella sp. GBAus27b]|nr:hypothetical protein BGX31_000092 [Mortierella sp. GBA43]KAI8360299.1 PP-loop family-domain-containing protein [Mortierella sp. GBAus27b]